MTDKQARDRLLAIWAKRKTMIEYLTLKVDGEDWHGCADAANDLREMDIEIAVLEWMLGEGRKDL